uniref:Ferroptosis suppressor protein 1 n=1 Tax=Geotrypetes seraphini TaxID=260995 RepID=A0A6P8QUA7_GEOSA|nr:apoptosis-inducing factor 2 [Geotrypetes seraphini]XP_033799486.1 apoptosis-inducing factor 2 [Geotrypetes seraphini]
MGSKLSVDDSVCVVIVGGGFGGIAAASQLKSWGVPFVLVDMKEAFHHNVAALRASVENGFARKTFIPYAASFQDSFKQGKVISIDLEKQYVLLEDGEKLHFSHLILATGSDGPFPGKFNQLVSTEKAIQVYEDLVQEVQKAKHIVVVGGGTAGVEMAAEIKTDYPDKEVTLIHPKTDLANVELQPRVRQAVKEILLKKDVQLILGQKVSNLGSLPMNCVQENMEIKLDKGTEIVADMVICCTGIKINSFCYRDAFGDKLADDGALKVNEELQVEGYSNIYAIGDCANVNEPKMAYHAGLHAKIVVTNIINSLTNKPLKSYKPGSLTMLISMGRNDGVGQINGWCVGSFVVKHLKSQDIFVGKKWKEMRQSMPH